MSHLDAVPFSGIIRIRDMMYARPAIRSGSIRETSASTRRTRSSGDASGDRREPQPLSPDRRRPAPARTAGRQAAHRRTARRSVAGRSDGHDRRHPRRSISCSRRCSIPATRSSCPDPEWPPAAGNILAARGVPVPLSAARRLSAGASTSTSSNRSITPQTRAIYINSPHNPTGGVLTRADLERIAAIVARARSVAGLRRSLRARAVRRRRARQPGVAARHVRADDLGLHVQQVVRDDRAAPRLCRRQGRSQSANG